MDMHSDQGRLSRGLAKIDLLERSHIVHEMLLPDPFEPLHCPKGRQSGDGLREGKAFA